MEQFVVTVTTMTDGSRTTAEASLIDWEGSALTYGSGSSGREPGDKSDAQTGKDLAVARALRSVAAHLERRATGRVKHADDVKAHRAEIARNKAAAGIDLVKALHLPVVQSDKSHSL